MEDELERLQEEVRRLRAEEKTIVKKINELLIQIIEKLMASPKWINM